MWLKCLKHHQGKDRGDTYANNGSRCLEVYLIVGGLNIDKTRIVHDCFGHDSGDLV